MILNSLNQNINIILERITSQKLDAYTLTQTRLQQVDVSTDQQYQRQYNGFYRVRLPSTNAYPAYYKLLEENKNNRNLELIYILNELLHVTGRVETSFGSKLIATINPHIPPLDSVVLGHLNLILPARNRQLDLSRIQTCVKVHDELVGKMNHLIAQPDFKQLKARFKQKFPCYSFTDVKILDLLLWQHRP